MATVLYAWELGANHGHIDAFPPLAAALRSSGATRIHSTDYIRTRDTAGPLAAELGLTVELYNPRDLAGFAESLRAQGGRHVVVGHSNTTPQMAELLGGDPGEPIVEATEYDRLYVVTVGADESVTTVLLRYGTPSPRGQGSPATPLASRH